MRASPRRKRIFPNLPLIGRELNNTFVGFFVSFPVLMIGFKEVKVLSWNVWGAANRKAQRHIMDVIRKHSPTFLIIMETHTNYEKTKNFWIRAGYASIHTVDARGHSGGI
jgi:hypothetical protein